jgi:hypothetical protein
MVEEVKTVSITGQRDDDSATFLNLTDEGFFLNQNFYDFHIERIPSDYLNHLVREKLDNIMQYGCDVTDAIIVTNDSALLSNFTWALTICEFKNLCLRGYDCTDKRLYLIRQQLGNHQRMWELYVLTEAVFNDELMSAHHTVPQNTFIHNDDAYHSNGLPYWRVNKDFKYNKIKESENLLLAKNKPLLNVYTHIAYDELTAHLRVRLFDIPIDEQNNKKGWKKNQTKGQMTYYCASLTLRVYIDQSLYDYVIQECVGKLSFSIDAYYDSKFIRMEINGVTDELGRTYERKIIKELPYGDIQSNELQNVFQFDNID